MMKTFDKREEHTQKSLARTKSSKIINTGLKFEKTELIWRPPVFISKLQPDFIVNGLGELDHSSYTLEETKENGKHFWFIVLTF